MPAICERLVFQPSESRYFGVGRIGRPGELAQRMDDRQRMQRWRRQPGFLSTVAGGRLPIRMQHGFRNSFYISAYNRMRQYETDFQQILARCKS